MRKGAVVRRTGRRITVAIAVALCTVVGAAAALAADAPATAKDAPAKGKKKAAAAPKQEPAPPGEHSPQVKASFVEFCEVWMTKLVERERFNKKQIKWLPAAAGVQGEYVGYSTEHNCDLRPPGSTGTPVGKVTYREFIYRKRGASADAADTSEPEIIEVTEITEIFRQEKGKWVY